MNTRKTLMLALLGAIVCVASAGVGAADGVNVTFEGHFGGTTEAVTLSGNYTYIGQGQDFVVLDTSNPAAPSELSRLNDIGDVESITVSGNYAYIANYINGLLIVNVSDPEAPTLTGCYDTAGNPEGVTVSGNYVYVADGSNGLVILRTDVVTPQKGDLNDDNQITSADAVIALEIAIYSRPCDPQCFIAADVSGDNRVTSLDALMILQAASGAIVL